MKAILMILAAGMLFSCTEQKVPDDPIPRAAIPYGSNMQLESIRKDIKTKYAGFSFEEKLVLCLQEFYLADPEYLKYLQENPPESVKAVLLENDLFLKICQGRKVDPNDISEDYFSPKKPGVLSKSELTQIINIK